MKILIVKLSSLGDVVHAMPAVQDLLQVLPQARIDWVVERAFAPLVRRCRGVNQVIACELRRWRHASLSGQTWQAFGQFRHELQGERYDAVLDLQGLSKSALVAWLAKLKVEGRRFAMANQTEGSGYEAPTRWVADVALRLPAHVHAITRSRELCAAAFTYALPKNMSFGLQAQALYDQSAINSIAFDGSTLAATVALVHGSSRADKLWPVAHWVQLGLALHAQGLSVALLHGSDDEERRAHEIAAALPQATVWPRLGLDALVDALAHCAGVIGVDSGLSHVAVALDLPHVQIYNFATAWRTGPLPPDNGAPRQVSVVDVGVPSVAAVWQAWCQVAAAADLANTVAVTAASAMGPV